MKKLTLLLCILTFSVVFTQEKIQFTSVIFTSICCGTTSDKNFKDFITDFKTQNNIQNIYGYSICCLGDEGEYSNVIDLRNFSLTKKNNFIDGLEKIKNIYDQESMNSNSKGSIMLQYFEDIQELPFPKEVEKSNVLRF